MNRHAEKFLLSMMESMILVLKSKYGITSDQEIAFYLRNSAETALLKERVKTKVNHGEV